jgi:hypothetical protein
MVFSLWIALERSFIVHKERQLQPHCHPLAVGRDYLPGSDEIHFRHINGQSWVSQTFSSLYCIEWHGVAVAAEKVATAILNWS